jgi:hypothetical protein
VIYILRQAFLGADFEEMDMKSHFRHGSYHSVGDHEKIISDVLIVTWGLSLAILAYIG